jgi:chorismate mutase-like protein
MTGSFGGGNSPDGPSRAGGGGPDDVETGERKRLEALRRRIQEVDEALVDLIGERRRLVLEIGDVKSQLGLPVLDPGREAAVVRRAATLAREKGVDEELTRDVIWRIMASAREDQESPPPADDTWGPERR